MNEMLFGSGPQLWPTLPGMSLFHTLPGPRVMSGGPPTMTMSPGQVPGMLPLATATHPGEVGQPLGSAWPPLTSVSLAGAAPLLAASSEYAGGISPQALLAVVAIRRGQPMGPTTDQEIEDFVCDALDLLAGTNDVEVRCENGRATLTGIVPNKRVKRDAGEILWAIPSVNDVQNNITIAARRRARGVGRETETSAVSAGPGRKQA